MWVTRGGFEHLALTVHLGPFGMVLSRVLGPGCITGVSQKVPKGCCIVTSVQADQSSNILKITAPENQEVRKALHLAFKLKGFILPINRFTQCCGSGIIGWKISFRVSIGFHPFDHGFSHFSHGKTHILPHQRPENTWNPPGLRTRSSLGAPQERLLHSLDLGD